MPFGSSTSSMVVPSLAKAIIALVKTAVQAMSGQGHLREGMKRPLFISPPSVGCAARARLFGVLSAPGAPVTTLPPRIPV